MFAAQRNAIRAAAALLLTMGLAASVGCGRAATGQTRPAAKAPAAASGDEARFDELRRSGRLQEFVESALAAAGRDAASPRLRLVQGEALLASGRPDEAELLAWPLAALDPTPPEEARAALKLWYTARLRQAKPLSDGLHQPALQPEGDDRALLSAAEFWRRQLAGRAPYRVLGALRRSRLKLARQTVWVDQARHEVEGVEVDVNGVTLPSTFVDSGAQYTVLSAAAARRAGISLGPANSQLAGFASAPAQPGLARRLRIGDIELADVPVMVGDWAPLELAAGQMAIGADLMFHVRWTLDYGRDEALAELASEPLAAAGQHDWEVPLWTFSQACLAEGKLTGGEHARVLLDTGNRVGTYASARWLGRVRPRRAEAARLAPLEVELVGLALGGRELPAWPVRDRLPAELERLDVVDVLIGHDLLDRYRVLVDLRRRVLRLCPAQAVRTEARP